jgi:hypothetical protein
MAEIAFCKIYPPIGIARVGDSENDWFLGPELPDEVKNRPDNFTFRDEHGRIKRQAARFRVYAFDMDGLPIKEVTALDGDIKWSVELANKKASWFAFRGAKKALSVYNGEVFDPEKNNLPDVRNPAVGQMILNKDGERPFYHPDEDRAHHLEIHGGVKEISGVNLSSSADKSFKFIGKFKDVLPIELGELQTDHEGRLIVLGGRGNSEAIDESGKSIRDLRFIRNYANNTDWHDDISDGPVKVEVVINGIAVPVKDDAWVIVAPPDFAPDVDNLISLYDVMEEVAYYNPQLQKPYTPSIRTPDNVTFNTDIAPILGRVEDYRWVNERGLRGHGYHKPGDFKSQDYQGLDDTNPANNSAALLRKRIFGVIREPAYAGGPQKNELYDTQRAISQATTVFMPPLAGDEGDPTNGEPATWLSVTYLQYERLKNWSDGKFQKEGDITHEQSSQNELVEKLSALTKTPLDCCTGGAFYPGIEMTSISREASLYKEAFRLDASKLKAGDISKYMALPWQADFYECREHWWPAQRPDDVITTAEFEKLAKTFKDDIEQNGLEEILFNRIRWDRGIGPRSRPTFDYLISRLLPDPANDDISAYIELLTVDIIKRDDPRLGRLSMCDPITILIKRITGLSFTGYSSTSPEDLPSPWRLQYIGQDALDKYAGLYFHCKIASPNEFSKDLLDIFSKKMGQVASMDTLKSEWNTLRVTAMDQATKCLDKYVSNIAIDLKNQIKIILTEAARPYQTASEFRQMLLNNSVAGIEAENLHDFTTDEMAFKQLCAVQMFQQLTDYLYILVQNWSGDMDMVNNWLKSGFVISQNIPEISEAGYQLPKTESERPAYDGQSYRDYFYYLTNIQDYPDFEPYAKQIANDILNDAQFLIDNLNNFDSSHPESFVPYTKANFAAKLEEIYEILRSQAVSAKGWRTDKTRDEWIQSRIDSAPFNQMDGTWLRYIANAGPSDQVRSLLFEVWSDEIGNGDPALHHGNLYTTLLESLGKKLPPVNSRAYADCPEIEESMYIGAVFQLAISLHTESFLPELLGMTLFLEWEVLSLVPRIEGFDYIGIDSHFWQMHVGIDNASEGHGAKAKEAVELYLDEALKNGGDLAVQTEWRRIWRGFVGFATAGYGYLSNKDILDIQRSDLGLSRAHPGSPEDDIVALIQRKAHYGSLNHRDKKLGGNRINDLFGEPDMFVTQMAKSPWIVPGRPDESKLLNHLTTFNGPMYKVFDDKDLQLWRDWIEWLGKEGDTANPKGYIGKADSMLILLFELQQLARSSEGHKRHRLTAQSGSKASIMQLFESDDLIALMSALSNPENDWIVPFDPGSSSFILELAKGDRPMGAALDRRFSSLGNLIGRQVVIRWIEAGCPIPGKKAPSKSVTKKQPFWNGRQLLVQQVGMGAVH